MHLRKVSPSDIAKNFPKDPAEAVLKPTAKTLVCYLLLLLGVHKMRINGQQQEHKGLHVLKEAFNRQQQAHKGLHILREACIAVKVSPRSTHFCTEKSSVCLLNAAATLTAGLSLLP